MHFFKLFRKPLIRPSVGRLVRAIIRLATLESVGHLVRIGVLEMISLLSLVPSLHTHDVHRARHRRLLGRSLGHPDPMCQKFMHLSGRMRTYLSILFDCTILYPINHIIQPISLSRRTNFPSRPSWCDMRRSIIRLRRNRQCSTSSPFRFERKRPGRKDDWGFRSFLVW